MGLVIEAPLDALLPTVEATAGAAVPPAADGLFASLLASLATAVEGEAKDLGQGLWRELGVVVLKAVRAVVRFGRVEVGVHAAAGKGEPA